MLLIFHIIEETECEKSEVTHPTSHSQKEAELEWKPGSLLLEPIFSHCAFTEPS